MLAQQGALAELVSQNLILSRNGKSMGNFNNRISRQYNKTTKSNERTKKSPGKRRKGRNKYKKK